MLKPLAFLFCAAALLVIAAPPDNDHPFNGKWNLDKSASTASEDIPDHVVQQIKQKGDELTIQTTWQEPQNGIAPLTLLGIMTTQLKLTTNGSESTNQIGPFKQVSKTTANGNQLVTDWTALVNGATVTGHWTRSLSDDGKGMTLDIKEQTSDGKSNEAHLVFKKK